MVTPTSWPRQPHNPNQRDYAHFITPPIQQCRPWRPRLLHITHVRSPTFIPMATPTHHPELLELLLQAGDGALIPDSLGIQGVVGATQHADLSLQLGELLVQLVDGLPVLAAPFLRFLESGYKGGLREKLRLEIGL